MASNVEREVRFLKCYAMASTGLLIVLLLCGFTQRDKKLRVEEIDVERINVIEPNGKLDLVISNAERFPPPISNGKAGCAGPGLLQRKGR